MMATLPDRTKADRNWIPWIFIGGFGIVLIVNAVLVTLALTTFSGVETRHAYKTGLAYNTVLEADAAQAARGWDVAVVYISQEDALGRMELSIRDGAGRGIEGLDVLAQLRRPTHTAEDHDVILQSMGGGVYEAQLRLPFAGQWDVDVVASGIDAPYRARERLWVP